MLNTTTYRSVYYFKQPMREIDILNFLLDLSPELKATYDLYQDLLFALQIKNLERFNHLLQEEYPLISPEFQTSFQTFKTYQPYIKNTLTTSYTNGSIEGINNKIKVIKRIAFGYRSFYHFKSQILMVQNLTKPKVKILAA
ncbi:transposase [Turicibacter sanguinis]|nr:transposase [Turicibacter sanguinis]